ncbi:hypothetical protein SODALDRAFT_377650 [Sodiomyces alkalinus F11]|uniref:Uncharacterized protein n=1 Tax=Sodiomyces alkalinus (strain CBS 110278 / VKM F-3762 / F11) TaxID=1314773 RepID=A0A3N2PZ06_SODAK|nr:hypothetical protein SODALDRAFT_377650 [Sodiomyces alkalinus F11]ROT39722.1 hypothetical protein SODALDRAFT_377650 [Sodiomyces alkalinus F11]
MARVYCPGMFFGPDERDGDEIALPKTPMRDKWRDGKMGLKACVVGLVPCLLPLRVEVEVGAHPPWSAPWTRAESPALSSYEGQVAHLPISSLFRPPIPQQPQIVTLSTPPRARQGLLALSERDQPFGLVPLFSPVIFHDVFSDLKILQSRVRPWKNLGHFRSPSPCSLMDEHISPFWGVSSLSLGSWVLFALVTLVTLSPPHRSVNDPRMCGPGPGILVLLKADKPLPFPPEIITCVSTCYCKR